MNFDTECCTPVGHREKHLCSCVCALPRDHKGRHRCAVDLAQLDPSDGS